MCVLYAHPPVLLGLMSCCVPIPAREKQNKADQKLAPTFLVLGLIIQSLHWPGVGDRQVIFAFGQNSQNI